MHPGRGHVDERSEIREGCLHAAVVESRNRQYEALVGRVLLEAIRAEIADRGDEHRRIPRVAQRLVETVQLVGCTETHVDDVGTARARELDGLHDVVGRANAGRVERPDRQDPGLGRNLCDQPRNERAVAPRAVVGTGSRRADVHRLAAVDEIESQESACSIRYETSGEIWVREVDARIDDGDDDAFAARLRDLVQSKRRQHRLGVVSGAIRRDVARLVKRERHRGVARRGPSCVRTRNEIIAACRGNCRIVTQLLDRAIRGAAVGSAQQERVSGPIDHGRAVQRVDLFDRRPRLQRDDCFPANEALRAANGGLRLRRHRGRRGKDDQRGDGNVVPEVHDLNPTFEYYRSDDFVSRLITTSCPSG